MKDDTKGGMLIRTRVGKSAIFGQGLFAMEAVRKGTILCSFTLGSDLITEAQFLDAISRGVPDITRTGTRYAGKYFTVNRKEYETAAPTSFFNHSFEPNALCHCGIVLARRDLASGEELTIDYRTLVDATEIGVYDDASTGQTIRGFTARETLLRTAGELIAILKDLPEWDG